jgi:hypothetical protein
MRRTPGIALALAVLALMAPAAARPSAAQLISDALHEGLSHAALGGAEVSVDPATRRLPVHNIGSSGNDGVEIKWAKGARGYKASLPDFETDFATPGCVHTIVLKGTASGATVTIGTLAVTRNSDGSDTMRPDFSGVHAASSWLDLLDAQGKVVYSSCCKNTGYDIKMAKKVLGAARNGIQSPGGPKWIELDIWRHNDQSIEVDYPVAMLAHDGSTTVECYGARSGSKGCGRSERDPDPSRSNTNP